MNLNQKPDYYRCYRVLGLKAGCRWEQARRHYKLLSQRCHPDRYPDDPQARLAAERRQRAVNLAMRMIADYYRKYGRMPIPDRPRLRPPEPSADEGLGTGTTVSPPPVRSKRGRGRWLWMALLAVASLLWWFWPPTTEKTAAVLPQPAVLARSSLKLGMASGEEERFGFGDPPEVVRLVQGEPDAIKGDRWYYGRSIVYFENGRVAGWLNRAGAPLRADAERSPPSGMKRIRIGSSHKEVLRIQGEPLFRSETRWDYGPSFIEFQDGKVSGWHSSPLRPLRVGK